MAENLAVAVVGATGLVGREILSLLRERQFPLGEVRLLGSARTAGQDLTEDDVREAVRLLGPGAFDGIDVAFFSAGPTLAGEWAPQAVRAGASVVDCSSRFRLQDAVPLVVPEVNSPAVHERQEGIVANPSSTAIALTVVLAPLAEAVGLRRLVVSTYQGVASAGHGAVNALSHETMDLLNGRGATRRRFARRIAFNCVPQVGDLEPGGATTHELQLVEETRKILADPALAMQVTAVRVPVFFGLGLDVRLETEHPLDAEEATRLLREAPGLLVHDDPDDRYPTPVEVAGEDPTHVGRIRTDPSVDHGLALWVAVDSIRKGAALNAVQIAEVLIRGPR